MDSNDLTIVIVTFNSESKIYDCLKSIPKEVKILIVENSNNESFKKKLENQYQIQKINLFSLVSFFQIYFERLFLKDK